jgi:transposase
MTIDHSIEEPCEVTSLMHGFEAERRGRPLRLGSKLRTGAPWRDLPERYGRGRHVLIGSTAGDARVCGIASSPTSRPNRMRWASWSGR